MHQNIQPQPAQIVDVPIVLPLGVAHHLQLCAACLCSVDHLPGRLAAAVYRVVALCPACAQIPKEQR